MKNVIVFVEPPKEANDISMKAGNLYINRLCIDEDAAFELSGVHYFETSDILKSSANKSKGSKKGLHVKIPENFFKIPDFFILVT